MEVENPGAWNVGGLESLFDVLGSRSGRGSSWIEVDLGFKLNLGPVKVSGATIRATLTQRSGSIEASIRGLEAGIDIPGAIEGTGSLQLLSNRMVCSRPAGRASCRSTSRHDAGIIYAPPMVVLRLDVDLPAPIPLANTGFGLLGIGGLLGFSARPDYGVDGGAGPGRCSSCTGSPKDDHSFKSAPASPPSGFRRRSARCPTSASRSRPRPAC